jgi:hypothetical protein
MDRQFLLQESSALGPFTGDKSKNWYGWEREYSQIIDNFSNDRMINTFQVMVRGESRGKFQRALASSRFNPEGPMNANQHAVMIMNFLYIDEDKKHRDHEEFLENKQLSQETISAYINRFENRKLQAEDHGFLSKSGTKVRMGENQEPTLRPKEK